MIGAINKVGCWVVFQRCIVSGNLAHKRTSYMGKSPVKGLKLYCHIASRCIDEVSSTFSTNFIYEAHDMSASVYFACNVYQEQFPDCKLKAAVG
jgi:hypothetical protein